MMSSDQSKAQIGKTQLEIQLWDYTFLVEITLLPTTILLLL